jgi:predicted nucleic acid-binding protein
MYTVVLDTNVLVAAFRSRNGASFRILSLLGDPRWRPAVSAALLLEHEAVLKRAVPDPGNLGKTVDTILDRLVSVALLCPVRFRLRPSLPDPDDELVLEIAVSRTIALPEDIWNQAEQAAAREHVTVEELVSAALTGYLDQLAGIGYLKQRANRSSEESFREALRKIPDTPPDPEDRL